MKHILILLTLCFACNSNQEIIIKSSTQKISITNPTSKEFPGGRGANQLIIYTSDFGEKTGTNMWGIEAVVKNGVVTRVGDNNSKIPKNGFVVSANGAPAKWITDHLYIGVKIKIENNSIKSTETTDSKISYAHSIIKKAEKLIQDNKTVTKNLELEKIFKKSLKTYKSNKSIETAEKVLKNSYNFLYASYPSCTNLVKALWWNPREKSAEEMEETFKDFDRLGINTICPQTIFNSYAIYPNAHKDLKQNPYFKGWDPLETMVKLCKKYNIRLVPWVWCYLTGTEKRNSPFIKTKKEWISKTRDGKIACESENGHVFFCPSVDELADFWIEVYDKMFKKYGINHLQLDYIRYPVSEPWEKDFCYCDRCKTKFKKTHKFDPSTITPKDKDKWAQWDKFRMDNITNFVTRIRKQFPNIILSADVFPDEESSKHLKKQDWTKWIKENLLDEIYTMSYTADVSQVKEAAEYLVNNRKGKTKLYTGLAPFLNLTPEILLEEIYTAQKSGVDGIVLFAYHSLTPELKEALIKGSFRK
jgi:uncharacterized lipoprotein YddW (UPF0748 family)